VRLGASGLSVRVLAESPETKWGDSDARHGLRDLRSECTRGGPYGRFTSIPAIPAPHSGCTQGASPRPTTIANRPP